EIIRPNHFSSEPVSVLVANHGTEQSLLCICSDHVYFHGLRRRSAASASEIVDGWPLGAFFFSQLVNARLMFFRSGRLRRLYSMNFPISSLTNTPISFPYS